MHNIGLDNRSLTERVAAGIEQLITENHFKSGDKLPNELELSKELGIGRSTLREAIKILVSRNVLEIRRGSGTFVCEDVGIADDPLGFRFIKDKKALLLDLCDIRMMLEPQLAALAAEHADSRQIEEIQMLCNEVAALIDSGEDYGAKDIQFHLKIASSTGNQVVPKLIPIIDQAIDMYVGATNHSMAGRAKITHQAVADGIRNRDKKAAFEAMQRHIKDNKETILELPDF